MWRTLFPFWGEEYEVYLPPTFHCVSFYVMDEDALRCDGHSFLAVCALDPGPPSPSNGGSVVGLLPCIQVLALEVV